MSIEKIHVDFTFNYGSHPPRPSATPLFEQTRKDLIESKNMPCEDCGITQSVLTAMKNSTSEAAKVAHLDMELHHDVEWAAMQAMGDLSKAMSRLSEPELASLTLFMKDHPEIDQTTAFLDGPWNAKHVLCRACHISQHPTPDFRGIHRVGRHYSPQPNEVAVDVAKDGMDPEAPADDTPAITAAKIAAHFIAKQQGSPVEVHHPHTGLIHTATAA